MDSALRIIFLSVMGFIIIGINVSMGYRVLRWYRSRRRRDEARQKLESFAAELRDKKGTNDPADGS